MKPRKSALADALTKAVTKSGEVCSAIDQSHYGLTASPHQTRNFPPAGLLPPTAESTNTPLSPWDTQSWEPTKRNVWSDLNKIWRPEVTISIIDRDLLQRYYEKAFQNLQQTNCRALAKAYIKLVEPCKQVYFPYNGRTVVAGVTQQLDPEATKPPWWPCGKTAGGRPSDSPTYTPSGRILEYLWESTNEDRRLKQITDAGKVLVSFNYEPELGTAITTAPGSSDARTFSLRVLGGRLEQLKLLGANELFWNFQYNYYGPLWCIDKVVSPSGLQEIIEYNEESESHKLPPGPKRPYPSIPNVSKHTLSPYQHQPKIVTRYGYSDQNFLGYGSGMEWTDKGDNLYLLVDDYKYNTTVFIGEEKEMQTEYTYNKFHLETCSKKKQGKSSVTQEITYYAKPIGYFANQDARYLLPKESKMTYSYEAKVSSEVTSYEYDDAGNPTKQVQPDGQIIERKYYGPGSEKDCPADPWGFVRYLKEEIVTPAPSENKTPTRRTTYSYLSLPTLPDALSDYFVSVQEERCLEDDSKELTRTSYTYVSDPASPDHGRLSRQVDKIFGASPITHDWSYKVESSANQFTQTLGRLAAVTAAVGTDYEATRLQAYSREPDEVGYCLTLTDVSGVQTRYYTDGLGRVIRSEKQENSQSQTFRVVQERSYNEFGQCIKAVEVDWLYGDGPPTEQRSVMQLEYDDWGQLCLQTTSDDKGGKCKAVSTVMDPITRTRTEGIVGEGQTRTLLNLMGLTSQKTALTKEGNQESTVSYQYDGFGRQVSETDCFGRKTQYELDSFDRVIKATWPGDRVVHTEYTDQSVSILPTSIKLGSHQLGEQTFDGLDRTMTTSLGSRTLTNNFNRNVNTEPDQVVLPNGQESIMKYVPELNYAVEEVNEMNRIEFDKRTGAPVFLDNGHLTQKVGYYNTGLVSREDWELQDGGKKWSTEYTYSLAGKIQSYMDVHQQKQVTDYNSFGQPERLMQGPIQVEYVYDEAQRLLKVDTTSTTENQMLSIQLGHDDFGREEKRTVTRGSSVLRIMEHSYGPTGLLVERSLQTGSGSAVRTETFGYDNLNRLAEYTCTGSEPPVDEYGNLKSQKFEFDRFDNLEKVTTTFQDGSDNIAIHYFADDDPTQLIRITHTHSNYRPEVKLKYDGNGSLTEDEKSQKLTYDDLNRLAEVRDSNGALLCEYRYDALGRLVCQKVPDQADTHLFYRGDSLVAIQTGERKITLVAIDSGTYWGQIVQDGSSSTIQNWVSDGRRSVLAWVDRGVVHHTQYTPYGFSPREDSPPIGFNGQWRDPVTGWYHLGNGYRVYNPILMRFHTPDPSSPFTSGEINPYAYCLGDPINRVDPSGHFSLFGIEFSLKDILMTVVSIAVGTALGVLTGGASLAIQIGVSVAVGVVTDFTASVTYDVVAGDDINWGELGINLGLSALTGLIPGLGDVAERAMRKPVQAAAKASAKGAKKTFSQKVVEKAKGQVKSLPKRLRTHQSSSQNLESSDNYSMVKPSSFTSRDSIRPVLKETQSGLGLYAVHPSAGVCTNTGQSVAQQFTRDLRAFYGQQDDSPIHGLGAQHGIRAQQDAIRGTVRRPHNAADWASVPGLKGS
ncbi:RHS Repeat protein [Penicillium rubens]|nr:RHS Repeat protein [Penicillium rubens]